ncbi:hypothetical protein PF008_g28839 [Phytophthora fragariae]|uniref:Uncharacterized protein n=1 Tax=Phytophthora fragariae TaxID=53985 RepID=A0A6G0QAU8_9STRA|nr:hypothetical protein PF008_g28839 [Phytophthora fragariae]
MAPATKKSAGKKPAAKRTRAPRVMPFDFDHDHDTDSSDEGEDARDEGDSEGGDSDTAAEPSDEEGGGSSSEEASAKVETKFWCAYKGCRNPPMVKQSFRRHLEMHLAKGNKECTPKRMNKYKYSLYDGRILKSPAMTRRALMLNMHVYEDGLRQLMKAERAMAKEQLVMKKNQATMMKAQEDILSHVEKDGVVAMVFSLTKCVEELSKKVDGFSSQGVTDIIDQAGKIKQTIKKKKREAKLASPSPKRPHEQDSTKIAKRALQQANDGEKKSQQARVEANETLVETAYKTWWGEIHLYTIARMAKAADDALGAAREAVKKRERCARALKREEKNPSKSAASLAAAQAEFEAAKVEEEDALELKEVLVNLCSP